jgi:hypothetical protein
MEYVSEPKWSAFGLPGATEPCLLASRATPRATVGVVPCDASVETVRLAGSTTPGSVTACCKDADRAVYMALESGKWKVQICR